MTRIQKILIAIAMVVVLVSAIVCISTAVETNKLNSRLADVKESVAYQISVNIVLYEEVAEANGIEIDSISEWRQAWLDNPCYETAKSYSEKLSDLIPLGGSEG